MYGAVGDLALFLGALLPHAEASELRALVLRYCLASFELTFMQASDKCGKGE